MAQLTVVYEKLMTLHERLGLPAVTKMPGHVWTHQLDEDWFLALNANPEPVTLGPEDGSAHPMLCKVHPYCCGVWFHWWYVGEFDPQGGVLVGSGDAEDDLIAAIERAITQTNSSVDSVTPGA